MKVLFISSGKENHQPGPIVQAQAISLQGKSIHITHFTVNQKGFMGYLREYFRLQKFLKDRTFDVIHAHYGLTGLIGFLVRRKEKLVVSFMGDDLLGSRKSDGRIKRASIIFAHIHVLMIRWIYDFAIVKSKQMLTKVQSKNVILIPNGVNTSIFIPKNKKEARENLKICQESILVIFVSMPSRAEKNYKLAEQAVRLCNIPNICLLPLSGLDQQSLVDYYNAADVLVLTSFHEGSPNVIKEAMACNCPIVSTDVGDVRWLLSETEGSSIAGFEPEDFADKLKMTLKFTENVGRTNGRKRILDLGLTSEDISVRIINVYSMVLDKPQRL